MSETRCLYRADRDPPRRPGNGAPRGGGKQAVEARQALETFIEGQGIRDITLDTMTQPERVFLEIDMLPRAKAMHSSDYDPLR